MSVYKRSELGAFIMAESDSYDKIVRAIHTYAFGHKNSIPCLEGGYFEKEETQVFFRFAHNIIIKGDIISFDAGIEAYFIICGNKSNDWEKKGGSDWFLVRCEMKVTDKLDFFRVLGVELFTYSQKQKLQGTATENFIPVIRREEYEAEAEAFLKEYCPEALTMVMQVPIRDVVEKRMELKVIDDVQLTKDLAVFGQICFNNSIIKIYNSDSDIYNDKVVERGTIFIDPNTVFLRCVGCANNTLAHEAFHWWRHRTYATIHGILRDKSHICYRCPTTPARERKEAVTDEDWMEIQANAIAPKILMPKKQTEYKIKQLVKEYGYGNDGITSREILQDIIDELASFYSVSKQAAKIRMIELGYPEAAEVYNYDKDCFYTSHEINKVDAYKEILINEEFKALIDMELFRFAEGCFVINTDKYLIRGDDGNYCLTDYAKDNLTDCALNFRYDALELIFKFNREQGVLYKIPRTPRAVKVYMQEYNEELVNKALEEVSAAVKAFDDTKALGDETVAQTLLRYMKNKKWNSTIFQEKTGLKTGHYSKIKNKPNRVFELPVLVSICVGLDLPHGKSLEILEKAGFKLNTLFLEQHLYNHILSTAGMRNIHACNEFLIKASQQRKEKVRLLGSSDYDGYNE